jgi:U6 snRNA-associated Sm-like protein LSm7
MPSFLLPNEDPETKTATDVTRELGLAVVRGTQVSLVAPQDGSEEIANPFLQADDGDETLP